MRSRSRALQILGMLSLWKAVPLAFGTGGISKLYPTLNRYVPRDMESAPPARGANQHLRPSRNKCNRHEALRLFPIKTQFFRAFVLDYQEEFVMEEVYGLNRMETGKDEALLEAAVKRISSEDV